MSDDEYELLCRWDVCPCIAHDMPPEACKGCHDELLATRCVDSWESNHE